MCVLRVYLPLFPANYTPGVHKPFIFSGLRVKGWGNKLYTNCSPWLFLRGCIWITCEAGGRRKISVQNRRTEIFSTQITCERLHKPCTGTALRWGWWRMVRVGWRVGEQLVNSWCIVSEANYTPARCCYSVVYVLWCIVCGKIGSKKRKGARVCVYAREIHFHSALL